MYLKDYIEYGSFCGVSTRFWCFWEILIFGMCKKKVFWEGFEGIFGLVVALGANFLV